MTENARVALITGGSKGLGFALAASLIDDGWSVVIDGRDAEVLESAATQLRDRTSSTDTGATAGAVTAIAGDIADPAHRQALADSARSIGTLALLVNNASVLGPSPLPRLANYPLEQLTHVIDVNLVGALGLIQATLPELRRSGGTIIDITSDAAVEGYEGWGGYGASKAALEQLSNVLAAEETTVHVYWFDPGDMRTAMHQEAFPGEDISDRPEPATVVPALRRLVREAPPSGRYRVADLQEQAAAS